MKRLGQPLSALLPLCHDRVDVSPGAHVRCIVCVFLIVILSVCTVFFFLFFF